MSNAIANPAATTIAPVTPDLKEFKLTPKHKWHQEAASVVMEAGLRDVPNINIYYKLPETENMVQASECVRDIIFYILNIPAGTPFPREGLKDATVMRAWYEIYTADPTALIEPINELGKDCKLMQFVFIGTESAYNEKVVADQFKIKNEKHRAFMNQWWDQLRVIARGHFTDVVDLKVCEDDENEYTIDLPKLVKLLCDFGDIIDLGYWDTELDLVSNLIRCNLSVHRVIEYIREELNISRQDVRGRLSQDFYTAPTTLQQLYQLSAVSKNKDGSRNTGYGRNRYDESEDGLRNMFGAELPQVFNEFCKFVFISFSSENANTKTITQREAMMQHIFQRRYGNEGTRPVLSLAHWNYVLRHAGWLNGTHKHTEDGVSTQHHGHDFLMTVIGADINLLENTTPADLVQDTIRANHQKTVSNLSRFKFPQLPQALLEKLPAGVEFINSPPQLYTEGNVMHHCCGGDRYMRDVSRGESWFFHIMTPESNMGVTTELEYSRSDKGIASFRNNQSRGLQNCNPSAAEDAVIHELLTTINEFGKLPEQLDWAKKAIEAAAAATSPEDRESVDSEWDDY